MRVDIQLGGLVVDSPRHQHSSIYQTSTSGGGTAVGYFDARVEVTPTVQFRGKQRPKRKLSTTPTFILPAQVTIIDDEVQFGKFWTKASVANFANHYNYLPQKPVVMQIVLDLAARFDDASARQTFVKAAIQAGVQISDGATCLRSNNGWQFVAEMTDIKLEQFMATLQALGGIMSDFVPRIAATLCAKQQAAIHSRLEDMDAVTAVRRRLEEKCSQCHLDLPSIASVLVSLGFDTPEDVNRLGSNTAWWTQIPNEQMNLKTKMALHGALQ